MDTLIPIHHINFATLVARAIKKNLLINACSGVARHGPILGPVPYH